MRCIRIAGFYEHHFMFKWMAKRRLVNRRSSLEQQYRKLLEEARDLQRAGDIQSFATKTAEAEECAQQIEALASENDSEKA